MPRKNMQQARVSWRAVTALLMSGAGLVLASSCWNRSVSAQPAGGVNKRAMWVWDASVITDAQNQRDLWWFCAQKHVSLLFVSVGDLFSERQREAGDKRHVTAADFAKFAYAAHDHAMQIEALDGDPSFALTENHARALSRLQRAIDYNRTAKPGDQVDGWQWDIEPYLLPRFKQSSASHDSLLQQFLGSAAGMRDVAKAQHGLRLGYTVPFFFSSPNQAVAWNGSTKPVAHHLLDILQSLPDSYVAIMAYRDHATGPNGSIEISQPTIDYAARHAARVRVWIGQETAEAHGDDPRTITYWQKGEPALEVSISQIGQSFSTQPVVAGVAIHHWASYRALTTRELVNIDSPQAQEAVAHRVTVGGTAKAPGAVVKLAVRPDKDIWYAQGTTPISADGHWSIACRLGNESTPAGKAFEIKASVYSPDDTLIAERTIQVVTR